MRSKSSDKSIIFVVSLGHSGSTLIGNVLGSHPQALHIGEFISPMKRQIEIQCQYCNEQNCPVWGGCLTDRHLKKVYRGYLKYIHSKGYRRRLNHYRNLFSIHDLYHPLFSQKPLVEHIVDSSKNIEWANYNSIYGKYIYKFVFIKRDLRAVWASLIRKYGISENGYGSIVSIVKQADRLINFFSQLPESYKHELYYESLVADPEIELNKLCDKLNLDWSPQMLNFYEFPHHTLGANFNTTAQSTEIKSFQDENEDFYNARLKGFRLDQRWEKELSDADLKLFNSLAGYINKKFTVS